MLHAGLHVFLQQHLPSGAQGGKKCIECGFEPDPTFLQLQGGSAELINWRECRHVPIVSGGVGTGECCSDRDVAACFNRFLQSGRCHMMTTLVSCCVQIDYYLSLNSNQFVGNSVSTFSAMLIMERWNAGNYASYYNGGNIPLEIFLPLYK